MGRPMKDTEQVAFRVPREWLTKADALAAKLAPVGVLSRTDALRAAIAKGFEAYEHGSAK